jgi:hypothetical protein
MDAHRLGWRASRATFKSSRCASEPACPQALAHLAPLSPCYVGRSFTAAAVVVPQEFIQREDSAAALKQSLTQSGVQGNTPLMRACENGHLPVVNLILGYLTAVEVNLANDSGWTSLMLAAYNGHAMIVTALLTKGNADACIEKKSKYTALCYACSSGHVAVAQALIKSARDDVHAQQVRRAPTIPPSPPRQHTATEATCV